MIRTQVYTRLLLRDVDTKDKLLWIEVFHTVTIVILEFISLDHDFALSERSRVEVVRKPRLAEVVKITILVELRNEHRLGTIRVFVEKHLRRL